MNNPEIQQALEAARLREGEKREELRYDRDGITPCMSDGDRAEIRTSLEDRLGITFHVCDNGPELKPEFQAARYEIFPPQMPVVYVEIEDLETGFTHEEGFCIGGGPGVTVRQIAQFVLERFRKQRDRAQT